jgi:hypothetical protein
MALLTTPDLAPPAGLLNEAGVRSRLSAEPFRGQLNNFHITAGRGRYAYAVCIPARNEAQWIGRTLAALGEAMDACAQPGIVVCAVNDTQDGTAGLVEAWSAREERAALIADVSFAEHARSAPVARRLALDLGEAIIPDGVLLTSDADTTVGRGWVIDNLAALLGGAALACGQIALDEAGLDALPPRVRQVGAVESAYFAALEQLWQKWTGAGPFQIRASGASLALTAATYRAVGRLPTPPHGEDRALCEQVRLQGLPVREIAAPGTFSSARLWGRAAHGCGEALRQRMSEDDPPCDESLVPVAILRRMASLFNAQPPKPARYAHFRRAWDDEGDESVPRMTYHQVAAELANARALLDRPAAAPEAPIAATAT